MSHVRTHPAGDAGATVVEFLAVVAVLGVLTIAAVPTHAGAVRLAAATAAAVDARNAGLLSHGAGMESGSYADAVLTGEATAAAPSGSLDGFRGSPGVVTRVWGVAEAPGGTAPAGFCVLSRHDAAGVHAMFDSSAGLVATGFTAGDAPGTRAGTPLPAGAPCERLAPRWRAALNPVTPAAVAR